MYQHDPSLDDLLRRPMQMASNDYDEYEEDEEEDLFGDDVLEAAQDDDDGVDFAAVLSGSEEVAPPPTPEPTPEQTKLFTRPGIRRNLIGYGLMTLFGFVPLVMLVLFGASVGLSGTMFFFSLALLAGLALSVYNLVYGFQHGYEFTVSFDVRTYFRFWPEVIVISIVLVGLSFWNLGLLGAGKPFTLSGQAVPMAAHSGHQIETEEEEVVFSSFENEPQALDTQAMVEQASSVAGGAVGIVGAPTQSTDINQLLPETVAGATVGSVGSQDLPASLLSSGSKRPKVLGSDNAFINTFFMGGALCAAFGYAVMVGLAGAIFGLLRRFETPFSQKRVEIINIETGEVTSDVQPIAPILKPINLVTRALIGLFYGATMGFALGLMVILPLYLFFRNGLLNPNLAPMLQALGLNTQPDLAFTHGLTLAGLMVPLVVILTKMAPQGMAVSEELMRQHYEIKPTGRFISDDQQIMVSGLANNPAAINFDAVMIPDDELETELANNRLMNELAMEDDNLTAEIIEEFGRDFEAVFGIDTRELIAQPVQRQSSVDRRKLASALDESFGELGHVPVEISAELGQATLPLTDWLNLREGTLVLLNKSADEDIDILFNGVRKGHGKLIVADDALAVRVSQTQFQNSNGHGSLI